MYIDRLLTGPRRRLLTIGHCANTQIICEAKENMLMQISKSARTADICCRKLRYLMHLAKTGQLFNII